MSAPRAATPTLRPRTGRFIAGFIALLVLTALEVSLFDLPVDRAARITALAGLAMTKAALMLMLFMNLRLEPRGLRAVALTPLLVAPLFAVALMLDTVFRVTGR